MYHEQLLKTYSLDSDIFTVKFDKLTQVKKKSVSENKFVPVYDLENKEYLTGTVTIDGILTIEP